MWIETDNNACKAKSCTQGPGQLVEKAACHQGQLSLNPSGTMMLMRSGPEIHFCPIPLGHSVRAGATWFPCIKWDLAGGQLVQVVRSTISPISLPHILSPYPDSNLL